MLTGFLNPVEWASRKGMTPKTQKGIKIVSKEIETSVENYIASIGVTFEVSGGIATKKDNWECDQWMVSFTNSKGAQTFEYFTGTGHRESKTKMPNSIAKLGPKILARVQWERDNLKPQKPSAASVLYCLISDARCGESNFEDFCDEFGYDSDSIKHMNIYKSCCETLGKMRKIFTLEQRNKLQELLEDF